MTALVGYCFKDGAFLVADTRRILNYPSTGGFWATVEVSKIHKLTDSIGFASCGTPIDEAKLEFQSRIRSNDSLSTIVNHGIQSYRNLLLNNPKADTNLIIFGHENNNGFIQHLIWDQNLGNFTVEVYSSGSIVFDGILPPNMQTLADNHLQSSKVPAGGYQLDFWSQLMMNDVINFTGALSTVYGANPVEFPIDLMIFRSGGNRSYPSYKRIFNLNQNLQHIIRGKLVPDNFTV